MAALNSAIITVGAVVLTLLTNSMVAYAIARNMNRPLFKALYFYFVTALFVPFPIIMLPVAKQAAFLHLDNRLGLIMLYWRVIFPLLALMNAAVGILTCLWAWNDFLLPLVILSDPGSATLPLVQYVFQSQFQTNCPVAFASYLLALAPMLIVYRQVDHPGDGHDRASGGDAGRHRAGTRRA